MTTLENQAEARVARKVAHRELRSQLDYAHVHVWQARDGVKAEFETSLAAYLAAPTGETLEAAIAARGRLDGYESLQTIVTSRRDQAADAGEGL